MKRLVAISVALASTVLGGFGIFQMNGLGVGVPIPPGVTLHAIDGGPTYMADHGLTTATASFTWNALSVGGVAPITYSTGWDSPNWFMYGQFLSFFRSQTDATTNWIPYRLNNSLGFSAPFSGQLTLAQNNGIQDVILATYLGQIEALDRNPGAETPGFDLYDEPVAAESIIAQVQGYPATTFTASASSGTLNVISVPTGGVPILWGLGLWAGINPGCQPQPCMVNTGYLSDGLVNIPTNNTYWVGNNTTGTGSTGGYLLSANFGTSASLTFGSETVTQIAYPAYSAATQDTRFLAVGMAGPSFMRFKNITNISGGGGLSGAAFFSQTMTSPSSKQRHIDMAGIDLFNFVVSHSQNLPGGINTNIISNVYDTSGGSPSMTMTQASKGNLYGDQMDILRSMTSAVTPLGIPQWDAIETSNAKANILNYVIQPVEMGWAAWSVIIHGGRGVEWFDYEDNLSITNTCSPEAMYCSYYQSAQTASFTGSISGNTLTVTTSPTGNGVFGAGIIAPGMVATSGVTGAQSTILQQLTTPAPATFTGVFSGTQQNTLTVSGVTGTIVVPSTLTGTGVTNTGASVNIGIRALVSAGVYTVDVNTASPGGNTITATPAYGGQGTYKVSGGTAASPVSMVYQQQFARGNNASAAMGMTGALTELGIEIQDMARVINSQFAYNYVTSSPTGYSFELGMSQTPNALQTFAFGTNTGIETMAKYYTGTSYTASTGETISPGFYVFADTRYPETSVATDIGTVTFTLGTSGCNGATVATVIGESRTRSITACTFTDTFNNAWTNHIYKIN